MLLICRPTPDISNKPRLLHPLETAIVVKSESGYFVSLPTDGSWITKSMKDVPKYISVPAIAATLAREKKDDRKTAKPKSDKP